jgi:2',3'-cyclic-nucleotide 2'-phosphodiesterase/3'-nucleotidase
MTARRSSLARSVLTLSLINCAACSTSEPLAPGNGTPGTADAAAADGASTADGASADRFDGGPRTLTILQTTDLHTNLMPWDYFSGTADEKRGLAKVATLIKAERAKGCTLLVDSGDTIQGTPLGTYYALSDNQPKHPMAVAMNLLSYDVMALGNHEFNYGMDVLNKFVGEVNFPVLGANVRKKADGTAAFNPYIIKDVCGVRVGILGLVTPGVTTWERPENIPGLRFDDPVETAQLYVPELKQKGADVVLVVVHSGPDRTPARSSDPASWLTDYNTWTPSANLPGENEAVQLARDVAGVDAVLSGHTHTAIPKIVMGDALVTQPGRWGSHLAEVSLTLAINDGHLAVTARDAKLLAVDDTVVPDPEMVAAVKSYHDTTLQYVETKIGTTLAAFPGGDSARFTDSALADLINTVQEEAAEQNGFPVDLSLAAIFSNTGRLPQGEVKLRDAYSVYVYDNTLYVVEITGKILRDALELDAQYFATLDPTALPASAQACKASSPSIPDYNWDLYSRIDYAIDVSKPIGSRVTRLKFKGADVTEDQTLRLAVNNYRGGGGGFPMFAQGKILWKSADGVRDFLASYVGSHPNLDPAAVSVCNFSLLPDLYTPYFAAANGPARCH